MDKKKLDAALASLEAICRQQIAVHEALLELADRKREAMAAAQTRTLTEVLTLENEKIQQLGEFEKQRLELVARLTQMLDPRAAEPMKMRELAMCFTGPVRDKLLLLRDELMQRMGQVREQAAVARRATETLVRHMQGVVQSIGAMSTGVCTYGKGGARPAAACAVSTFNTTA